MPESNLRSLNCPNCAAPLDFPEARSTVNCKFCGSVIERSDDNDAPTPDDESHALKLNVEGSQVKIEKVGDFTQSRHFVIKMRNGQPMVIESGRSNISITPENVAEITGKLSQAAKSKPVRRGVFTVGGCVGTFIFLTACVIPIVAVASSIPGIGSILNPLLSGRVEDAVQNASTLGTRYIVGNGAAFAPRADDAPPDVILYAQVIPPNNSNSEKKLVAVSGETPKFLWESERFSDDTYNTVLLTNADVVIAYDDDRLLAVRRTDGTTVWTANLADTVELNICENCVQLVGETVVALAADGTLEAFDAATGASKWQFSATQDSPRGLYVFNTQVAFMDESDASRGTLRVFDIADGQQRTAPILCRRANSSFDDEASWTTPILPTADGAAFYVAFSTCIQKWSAETLKQEWSTNLPDSFSGLSDSDAKLVTAEAIYVASYQTLLRADAATGELVTLWNGEDYAVRPLAAQGGDLLVLAQRQRGSTRFELWQMEGGTGELNWKAEMGEKSPLGDVFSSLGGIISDDETAWTFHTTPESVLILRFYAAADDVSHALRWESINWKTGTSSGEKEIKLGVDTIILSAPSFMLWRNNVLWMDIENQLLAFDVQRGQITYRWP
jgi:outer membrane protein assembly factor BamB